MCKNKCPETEDWIRIQDNVWQGKASKHAVFPFPLLGIINVLFDPIWTNMYYVPVSPFSASIVYLLESCENAHADSRYDFTFSDCSTTLGLVSGKMSYNDIFKTQVCLFSLKCWLKPVFWTIGSVEGSQVRTGRPFWGHSRCSNDACGRLWCNVTEKSD